MALDRKQLYIAALLFFMILMNYLDRQVLSVIAPVLESQIGLNRAGYAFAVNAFLLAYAFMYAGSGLVLDRLGTRRGLTLVVALWSMACGLHATVRSVAGLALFRFLLGMAEPGGWTGAVKTVSERFSAGQRGLVTGFFTAGAGVGAVFAPPLVVFLTLRCGWRTVFIVPAALGLVWIPFWLRATRHPAQFQPADTLPDHTKIKLSFSVLRDSHTLAYIACRFFGDSSGYFFLFWLPEYLVSVKGFSFSMLGILGWIPFCCSDVGALCGGYVSSLLVRSGASPLFARKVTMTLAAGLVAIGTLFQNSLGVGITILSLSISALGVGVWSGNLHTLAADAFPSQIVASVHGIAGSAGAVGGIVFNLLVGHFAELRNHVAVFSLLALLEPLGVAPLWVWLRRERSEGMVGRDRGS
jgi:ACS family hexuronate transporter-like MFS transporter